MQSPSSHSAALPEGMEGLSPEQQRALLEKLLRAKATGETRFPMSHGQKGLWYSYRRDPQHTAFNVFLATRVRSNLDVKAFANSIDLILKRHPSLRTTFSDENGELLQTIHGDQSVDFEMIDLPSASDREIQDRIGAEVQQPFDLENGPLLRLKIFRISEEDHALLALTHHIVVDFWSLVLLMDEVRLAYAAISRGDEPELSEPSVNYREFVSEQENLIAGSRGQELGDYWHSQTDDATPVVEIPTDYVRPSRFTGRAGNVALTFPAGFGGRVASAARRFQATPFAVILSVIQEVVRRYSGEDAFFVGSPFSGRSAQKYEKTVGFFVNVVPLKADLRGECSFHELVRRNHATMLAALENEAYPIGKIVDDAGVARDPSRSPLFQISCTLEKAQLRQEAGRAGFLFPGRKQVRDFAGLRQESLYVPVPTCHYDIEFIFELTEDSLHGMLCYCSDLFTSDGATAIAQNFVQLFGSLLEHADQPLSQVPWADESFEHSRAKAHGARTEKGLHAEATQEGPSSVGRMIVDAASGRAEHTAFRFAGKSVSYGQLIGNAADLAKQISGACRSSDRTGMVVPILAQRGPEAFCAMLATHLAGYAFVPVDAATPSISIAEQIPILGANTVVCDGMGAASLATNCEAVTQIRMSGWPEKNVGQPPSAFNVNVERNAPAYIVYTSGSTGQPKGVVVDHPAVCNTLRWRKKDIPLDETDRVLMLLSHQFDAGLGIAWACLSQGATVVVPTDEQLRDPGQLIDLMCEEEVTVLPAPPSILSLIVEHPRFASVAHNLKYVWTGGEAMPPEFPQKIRSLTNARFFNFYGPTEAAIEATFCEVTDHDSRCPVPIGKAIDNVRAIVVDHLRRPVPDTVPGELAIAGAGLARGYLNDDSLTKARFVPVPGESESKMYLTGDRARMNARGEIEFLGRIDHQVKLRGYRIELGEVDAAMEAYQWVQRAAAKVVGEGNSAKLIGYVQLNEEVVESAELRESLRRFMSTRLAHYKLPSVIVFMPVLPMTSSGKVDRKRLPDDVALTPLDAAISPRTAIEKYIEEVWTGVLGVDRIGVNRNFFDAGGSSLQAAMVTTQMSETLKVDVPTNLLFDLADIVRVANTLVTLYPDELSSVFGIEQVESQHAIAAEHTAESRLQHPLLASFSDPHAGQDSPLRTCFFIHPPGGIVVCYRELALQLAQDLELVAIRGRGLHGRESLPETLEAMAAEYVDALLTYQPHGPYVLGGWSLGGLVAYEVAQQLIAKGEVVDRLLLLDTTIPEGSSLLVPQEEQVNVGLEYGIEMTLDQLGDLAPEDQLPFLWEHAKKLGVLDDDSSPEVVAKALQDLQELFHHHVSLARNYQLKPIDTKIVLYRPTEVPCKLQVREDRGWSFLCGSVQVHFVPGHHHSMVQPPHVNVLADQLRTDLGAVGS